MPFAILAVPFDAYAQLPTPQHRWLLMALARYADRDGRCWPSMRQLAADARMSLATVCRYLKSMADLGVFHRVRQGVGRYRYTLAEAYVPRWKPRVSSALSHVSQDLTQIKHHKKQFSNNAVKLNVNPTKRIHDNLPDASPWEPRLRSWRMSGFWLPQWGPKPGEAGCFIPAHASVRLEPPARTDHGYMGRIP